MFVQGRSKDKAGVDRGQAQATRSGDFPRGAFGEGFRLGVGRRRGQVGVAPVGLVLQGVGLGLVQDGDRGGGENDPRHARSGGGLEDPLGALDGGADDGGGVLGLSEREGRGGVDQGRGSRHRLGPAGVGFKVGLNEGQLSGVFGKVGLQRGMDLGGAVKTAQGPAHVVACVQKPEGDVLGDEAGHAGQKHNVHTRPLKSLGPTLGAAGVKSSGHSSNLRAITVA